MEKIFTVSEINRYTKRVLKEDLILQNELTVSGEVSNLVLHSSGHAYFTLKEGGCQLRAAFFDSKRKRCKTVLQDGMKVSATGKIELYEVSGQYQIIVSSVKDTGLGALYEKFLKLKEQLEREGLFNSQYKKPIPYYPNKIVVITSETGAVIRDIIFTISLRAPNVALYLVPAMVQGDTAAKTIMHALEIAKQLNPDTVIIARGGGSFEDLNCFNDEELARAIFTFPLPIISAIGHETDFTIADYVADLRAPTPTAAGMLAVPDIDELKKGLLKTRLRIETPIENILKQYRGNLKLLFNRLEDLKPERLLQMRAQELDRLYENLENRIAIKMGKFQERLNLLKAQLHGVDPSLPLKKGFARITSPTGEILKSCANFHMGDSVNLQLQDGSIKATVSEVALKEKGERDEK